MKEYKEKEGARPNLHHRVVGALVLVALAVIFVPMVLDFRSDYGQVITRTNIPEKPEDFQVKEVPLNPSEPGATPGGGPPGAGGAGDPDAGPQTDDTEGATGGADPARQSQAGSAEPQTAPAEPPDGATVEQWMVQAGSFKRRANAAALRERIENAGHRAFVDRVVVEGETVWRVGVGPVDGEQQGEGLRDALERSVGLEGLVRRYDSDDGGR